MEVPCDDALELPYLLVISVGRQSSAREPSHVSVSPQSCGRLPADDAPANDGDWTPFPLKCFFSLTSRADSLQKKRLVGTEQWKDISVTLEVAPDVATTSDYKGQEIIASKSRESLLHPSDRTVQSHLRLSSHHVAEQRKPVSLCRLRSDDQAQSVHGADRWWRCRAIQMHGMLVPP
jgi:hypothetical protein